MPDQLLKEIRDTLEEFKSTLDDRNSTPSTAPLGPDDQRNVAPSRVMSLGDQFELRQRLRKMSDAELSMAFLMQATRKDTGIGVDSWIGAGGMAVATAMAGDPTLSKALDSGSGSALIRQDLEPFLYEIYIREFPVFDRLRKEPANGLVHAYNSLTSFGDAQFMAELGTVTDDQSTYVRQTTNVAVIATRRGISLKGEYAVQAGGAGFNPAALEMQGGMRAIAHKMQKTIFQGNATVSAGAGANTELGAYDPNGFDGFRKILDTARAGNVDPATSPTTTGNVRGAIDAALLEAMNSGGRVTDIYLRPSEQIAFNLQQDPNVRYMGDLARAAVGVSVQQVNTIFGSLGLTVVPGDSIGQYVADTTAGGVTSGDDVADIYLIDNDTVSMPYLGSEGPTVLDIPVGVSGQLVRLFIIFGMWGLAVKAPIFSNKLRVKQP